MEILKQMSSDKYGDGFVLKRMVYLTEIYVGLYLLEIVEEYKSLWIPNSEAVFNHKSIEFRDRRKAMEQFDKMKERLVGKVGDTESSHS
jgi:hypothetical protein